MSDYDNEPYNENNPRADIPNHHDRGFDDRNNDSRSNDGTNYTSNSNQFNYQQERNNNVDNYENRENQYRSSNQQNNRNSYYNNNNTSYGNNHKRTQYNNRNNFNNTYSGNNYGNKGNYKNYQKQESDEDLSNIKLYKTYVGTGNKEAPSDILNRMKTLAKELSLYGYILRTGALDGPDEAFEAGAGEVELYLPWRNFNNRESKLTFNSRQCMALAKMFHPAFDGLHFSIQAFLGKNVRMVMGKDLKSPTLFIICWSQDGAETSREKTSKTGNIGHIISIASALKIPVFNLGKEDAEHRLKQYLELPDDERNRITEI